MYVVTFGKITAVEGILHLDGFTFGGTLEEQSLNDSDYYKAVLTAIIDCLGEFLITYPAKGTLQ